MTYTFKLARRLAASRTFGMLPTILLFAACSGGDATAPDSSPAHPLTSAPQTDPRFRQTAPVTVSINPGTVTVETNQLIRFFATGRNSAGDTVGTSVDWTATGGTILPDGRFSAATTGSFMVLARSRQLERIDTAVVDVVRRQPELASIAIAPGSTTLAPGLSQTFLLTGYLKSGRAVPVGAFWSATGGTIDAGGTYVAGDTAGTYHVIATNTKLTISDTAVVTISAPPSLPPPPAPPAPPAPVLTSVTLSPASATLAPSVTRQFTAFGRLDGGDSVGVDVAFTATGGTISPTGLFTAGSSAGTFRVIARADSLADTSTVTVTVPLGSGPATGIPFGLFDGPANSPFTMTEEATSASTIVARIAQVRTQGKMILVALAGGAHSNYLTNGKFDLAKWRAKIDTYNTPAIQTAIADGVADGIILGVDLIDEPNHASWGGVLTKAMVDGMGSYVKAIFPTLPVGYGIGPQGYSWRATERYQVLDFIYNQYNWWITQGDIVTWRENVLAQAKLDRVSVLFGLNIINGGIHNYATRDCPIPLTGGFGSYEPACRMTAQQVRDWGRALAPHACGFQFWRHNDSFFANPDNQQAFRDVAAALANTPAKACVRQ